MVNDRQSLDLTTFALPAGGAAVEWRVSGAPVPYPEAVAAMEARVAAIADGEAPELVWLLEHPPALHLRHQRHGMPTCSTPVFRCFRPAAAGS